MAIIKLNSDNKIITKDGKVSCSCCGGPECCFYPATLTSVEEIPDSIRFYGEILTKNENGYGNTQNGTFLEEGVWASYRNGNRTERDCLFTQANIAEGDFGNNDDNHIVDNWADVYGTETPNGSGGDCPGGFVQGIIYRTYFWQWIGLTECNSGVSIAYFGCLQPGVPPSGYNNVPTWVNGYRFCCVPPGGQPGNSGGKIVNNGPLGQYTQGSVYEL